MTPEETTPEETTPEETTPKERRESQRDNQKYFSEKVSDLARYIGFGLAAAAFTLLSSDSSFAKSLAEAADALLIGAAVLGCLTVLFDYLQLLCGWASASIAAENKSDEYRMNTPSRSFRGFQNAFFYGKQVIAFVGTVTLIAAIGTQINLPL